MLKRLYPPIVKLIGGIGLGLALTYLVGVVLAFVPAFEDWAEFFVPLALWLLLLPYVLLIGHLVLRNHVGRFLLGREDFEDAVEYAEDRLKASLMRSRREVANHRMVAVRARIGLGDYERADELLEEADDELPGSYQMEARRWRFELALRRDDREAAGELVVQDPGDHKSARGQLAAVLACGAELALRKGDDDEYENQLEYALWEEGSRVRVRLVRALGMIEYEDEDEEGEQLGELLEDLEEEIGAEIPARRSELRALRALVAGRRGDRERADKLLEEAREGPSDEWTERVVGDVGERLGSSG